MAFAPRSFGTSNFVGSRWTHVRFFVVPGYEDQRLAFGRWGRGVGVRGGRVGPYMGHQRLVQRVLVDRHGRCFGYGDMGTVA